MDSPLGWHVGGRFSEDAGRCLLHHHHMHIICRRWVLLRRWVPSAPGKEGVWGIDEAVDVVRVDDVHGDEFESHLQVSEIGH